MLSIVFAGPDGVEYLIVDGAQPLPAVDVFPYPFGKLLLDQFLPVLGDGGFLFVEHRLFVAVLILDIVEHPHVFLIQRLLQDVVGAHTLGAVGGVGLDIGPVKVFLRDGPLAGSLRAQDFYSAPGLPVGGKKLHHKLLVHVDGHPVGSNAHTDLSSAQVLWLDSLQSLHLSAGGFLLALRGHLQKGFCHPQLAAHISGKVLVRCHGRKGLQAWGHFL